MLKIDVQMFGGRGAKSPSKKQNLDTRKGLKGYFSPSNIREQYKNVSFKLGKQEVVTDTFSMYYLNNTNLEKAKNDSVLKMAKDFNQKIKNAKDYVSIDKYITTENEIKVESETINNNMYFSTKRIKQAKSLLGKNTKVAFIYDHIGRPQMVFKNDKGEKGILLPMAKY